MGRSFYYANTNSQPLCMFQVWDTNRNQAGTVHPMDLKHWKIREPQTQIPSTATLFDYIPLFTKLPSWTHWWMLLTKQTGHVTTAQNHPIWA